MRSIAVPLILLAGSAMAEPNHAGKTFLQCGGGLLGARIYLDGGAYDEAADEARGARECSASKLGDELAKASKRPALAGAIKDLHVKLTSYADGILPRGGETKRDYAQRVAPLETAFREAQTRYSLELGLAK